jgi:tetratricopeptide (TPR) repeat protein
MKKIIQFCAALAVALGVAGCYNDFDMPAPRPAATDADFADMERISIADVKQLFLDEHKSISDTGSNSSWNDTKYTLIGQSESGKDYYIKGKIQSSDEEGNIYYYLFHCYYGQKASDKAFVDKAKQALLTGIEKFPKNERILDGLVQLYTSPEDNVGDPADLIALIDKAIENNPTNVDLWFGRGRIFYALKDYDQSIESFKKVVELKPDLYEGNYYLGVFYTIKGDEVNKEMNAKQYSSQAAYDADLKAVNAIYMEAIPWLEKALELKPEDPSSVELLKSICFRLRDEEGMMDKYTKYNEMFKKIQGQQ